MRKEKIKQLVDVMQAYVNGKTIQYYDVDLSFKIEHPGEPNFNDKWVDVDEDHLFRPDFYDYRIKPSPKYRPFANAEECWQEMQKHQPFGWIKKTCGHCNFLHIMELYSTGILINNVDNFGSFRNLIKTYDSAFAETTFADGTPFGIKEE